MYEGIMAGVDRSPSAADAALWAADEAARRGVGLELVHVAPPQRADQYYEEDGWELLDEMAALAGESRPKIKVSTVLRQGGPSVELSREAARVGYVVLGRPALGRPAARVAFQIAGYVHCPVVLVPRGMGEGRPGDVIVGVDGSNNAARALRFAFQEASLRGARLRVVYVHHGRLAPAMGTAAAARMPDRVWRLSEAALTGSHLTDPKVDVVDEAYRGDPHEVLLKLGEEAALLVVGSRGIGDRWGQAFGSVSRPVLHLATCPLAVVRR